MANSGMIRIAPGTVLVFEGLDATGKSTQVQRLRERVSEDSAQFVHMPTGFDAFSASLRRALEDPDAKPRVPLAKQLAHLACHAEAMPDLARIQADRALVLDRWWWSTIAYGWNALSESSLQRHDFEVFAASIWAPIAADQVFLFLSPHRFDPNNDREVTEEYRILADRTRTSVLEFEIMSEDEVHDAIVRRLLQSGLAETV